MQLIRSCGQERTRFLQKSKARLNSYTGVQIEVLAYLQVNVAYQDQEAILRMLVAAGDGLSLLGRMSTDFRFTMSPLTKMLVFKKF